VEGVMEKMEKLLVGLPIYLILASLIYVLLAL
jgi:hypothetical protein